METIVIDMSRCTTYHAIHHVLKRALDFPEYYGENLDALWDCLTGWIDTPVTIVFRGTEKMPLDVRKDLSDDFLPLFNRAEREGWGIHVVVES